MNVSLDIKRLQGWRIDRQGCAAGVGFAARALTRCKLPDVFGAKPLVLAFGLLVQSEGQSPDLGAQPKLSTPTHGGGRARASHPGEAVTKMNESTLLEVGEGIAKSRATFESIRRRWNEISRFLFLAYAGNGQVRFPSCRSFTPHQDVKSRRSSLAIWPTVRKGIA